jgi:hypothetical protein
MTQKDKPMHEDDRLEDLTKLVSFYRNLFIEADFNDDPLASMYEKEYERVKALLAEGKHYEPKF